MQLMNRQLIRLGKLGLIVVLTVSFLALSLAVLNVANFVVAQGPDKDVSGRFAPVHSQAAVLAPASDCLPIKPGQTITDAIDNGLPSFVDVTTASSTLAGNLLSATLFLRDLPSQFTFSDEPSYFWEVYVDVDNTALTGLDIGDIRRGSDYVISAFDAIAGVAQPLQNSLDVEIWQFYRIDYEVITGTSTFVVDDALNTLTVSGPIPGITANSRLVFWTERWYFSTLGYDFDNVACTDPTVPPPVSGPISNVVSSLSNAYIGADIEAGGKFVIGTTGGNPDILGDENKRLTYGFQPDQGSEVGTSFLSMRVITGTETVDISLENRSPVSGPLEAEQKILTVWEIEPNIRLTQTLSFMRNPFTGFEDMIKIDYEAANLDDLTHEIGLRYLLDTMVGNNDDAPFFIPGVGDIDTEQDFRGDNVPTHYTDFESDDFTVDSLKGLGILRGVGSGLSGPDRFVIANWGDLFETVWDYDPLIDFEHGDSAVALYWDPVSLAPGEKQVFATAYGLAGQVGGSGPGSDAWIDAQLETQVTEQEIDITFWVNNTTDQDFTGGFLTLLSEELQLIEPGALKRPPIDDVPANKTGSFQSTVGSKHRRSQGDLLAEDSRVVTYTVLITFSSGQVFSDTQVLTFFRSENEHYLPLIFK